MKDWILYRHTSPSGKVYIGITSVSPQKRWGVNGSSYTHCTLFMKAIKKYGWDNIKHEILFSGLPEKKAKSLEIDLIRHYKNLGVSYNITDGGDGALGRVVSEETRAKMRARKIGKPLSEEHRARIRANAQKLKGIPRSEEVKRKLHEANKGKKPSLQTMKALKEYIKTRIISDETIRKIVESNRKHGYAGQTAALNRNREQIGIKHRKAVVQLSLDGIYINTYAGAKFAEITTQIDNSSIARCCKGKQKTAGGFLWMYASDYLQHEIKKAEESHVSSVYGAETLANIFNTMLPSMHTFRQGFKYNGTKEFLKRH